MRSFGMRRVALVIFCFLTSPLAAQPGQGNNAPSPEAGSRRHWDSEVKGYGLTVDDAKKEALKHLVEEMTAFLSNQDPPLVAWRPSIDYVKRNVIMDGGTPGPDVPIENIGASKCWIYSVRTLDLAALRALDQEAQRAERRQERVILASQFFGGFALILAVLTGYLRVDEWTRGRYRRWLQMASVAILVLVGAGWGWLR
jgi:hypothetical protein